jgi:hypothetical protein
MPTRPAECLIDQLKVGRHELLDERLIPTILEDLDSLIRIRDPLADSIRQLDSIDLRRDGNRFEQGLRHLFVGSHVEFRIDGRRPPEGRNIFGGCPSALASPKRLPTNGTLRFFRVRILVL